MIVGGLNQAQAATHEIQQIIDSVSHDIKSRTGVNHPELRAVGYRTQVVASTNYFIKIKIV